MSVEENNGHHRAGFYPLASFVLIVASLHLGQEVLVPVAIATLLAFLLSPLVALLMKRGLGRMFAVVVTTTLAFSFLAGLGWLIATQTWTLVRELPKYEENINAKVERMKRPDESGALSRLVEMGGRFERELSAPIMKGQGGSHQPVPVRVEPERHSTLAAMSQVAMPVLRPLGTTAIVVIFVVAILLQEMDLRNRFLRLIRLEKIDGVRQAANDATDRIFRYLTMQLLVNACYGVCIGLGLAAIGIPNVLLWGLLAMLLRFIPYIGPWIAAAGPLLVALAIDPGWVQLASTLGLYVVVELVTANIIEIWLYGASTGVSSLGLMVAAVFWTWLWGIPGLLLSTPLTVCLMVGGKYIPGLKVLHVLLDRGAEQEHPKIRPFRPRARKRA